MKPITKGLIDTQVNGRLPSMLTENNYLDLLLELRDVPEIVLHSESVHWSPERPGVRGWKVRLEVFPTRSMLRGDMSAGWLELCQDV